MKTEQNNRAAIEQTIQDYFDGMHYGRSDLILKCFHEDGSMRGYMSDSGKREDMSRQEFADFVISQPAPSETGEPFDMTIRSIEIAGRTAMVEVRDLYMGLMFTDYLLLVNEDDHWSILKKLWHADEPEIV